MVRTRVLLIFFVIGLVVTLVLTVPVRILWSQLEQRVDLPLTPAALNGNLWRGQASLPAGDDFLHLQWRWQPGALLQGGWRYALELNADATQLRAQVTAYVNGERRVELDGPLGLHLLNPLIAVQGSRIEGMLQAERLVFVWQSGEPLSASGQARLRRLDMQLAGLTETRVRRAPEDALLTLIATEPEGEIMAQLRRQPQNDLLVQANWPADARLRVQVQAGVRDWLDLQLPGGRRVLLETELPAAEYLP